MDKVNDIYIEKENQGLYRNKEDFFLQTKSSYILI